MTPSELRQAITDTGDTQMNFAERVGVTVGTLSVWLKGPRNLKLLAVNAIQNVLKSYEKDPPTRKMWSGPKRPEL